MEGNTDPANVLKEKRVEKINQQLREALDAIKTLEGIIPICARKLYPELYGKNK